MRLLCVRLSRVLWVSAFLAFVAPSLWGALAGQDLGSAAGHRAKADALLTHQDLQGAERELRTALTLDARSGDTLGRLGEVLAAQKRYSAAITYLREAISVDSQNIKYQLMLSDALYANGAVDEAIRMLEKSVAEHPKSFLPKFNLATFYARQKRYADAVPQFR